MLLQISNQFSIQSLDNPMVIRMYDISIDLRVLNQYAFKLRYLNLLENPLSFAISFISHTENKKKHQIPHSILPIFQMKTIKSQMDSTRFIYEAKE